MKKTKKIAIHFLDGLEAVINNLINSLDTREINNSNVLDMLENENDEMLFTSTVDYLKQNRNEKSKEISLSSKKSLIVSIE